MSPIVVSEMSLLPSLSAFPGAIFICSTAVGKPQPSGRGTMGRKRQWHVSLRRDSAQRPTVHLSQLSHRPTHTPCSVRQVRWMIVSGGRGAFMQSPVVALQLSTVHSSSSSQFLGACTQSPESPQVSNVHGSLSVQFLGVFWQIVGDDRSRHVSTVHGSSSLQSSSHSHSSRAPVVAVPPVVAVVPVVVPQRVSLNVDSQTQVGARKHLPPRAVHASALRAQFGLGPEASSQPNISPRSSPKKPTHLQISASWSPKQTSSVQLSMSVQAPTHGRGSTIGSEKFRKHGFRSPRPPVVVGDPVVSPVVPPPVVERGQVMFVQLLPGPKKTPPPDSQSPLVQ